MNSLIDLNCFSIIMPHNIPKSLQDDHLKDTIISVIFRTNYNRDFIHGRIMELLAGNEGVIAPGADSLNKPEALLYGLDNFRIRLDRSQIQFNCITNYQGWERYGAQVKHILQSLADVLVFQNVQIRYISVFEWIRIFEHINGTIKINAFPPILGEEYAFSVNVVNSGKPEMTAYATVRLTNDKAIAPQIKASFVDISLESKTDNTNLQEVLEFIHTYEKLLFFSIITEEFKNRLGPVY